MPFECPVCGKLFKDLRALIVHVMLADSGDFEVIRREGIVWRLIPRERHKKWLEERNIPLEYDAVKKYLERLSARAKQYPK